MSDDNHYTFEDGDGSWPVMRPLPPSPVFDVWEVPRLMVSWDSQTGTVKFTPISEEDTDGYPMQ